MSKYVNDVRALSSNAAYMGVVFEGHLDDAIAQARAAPDHGLADQPGAQRRGRNRAALLQHLNLLRPEPSFYSLAGAEARGFIRPEPDPDPEPLYGAPPKYTESQWVIFDIARKNGKSIMEAFDIMEAYPYPAAQHV